jgi:hypothetical protein
VQEGEMFLRVGLSRNRAWIFLKSKQISLEIS